MSSHKHDNWIKPRKVNTFVEPPEKSFYIFCEGKKTEPNYFEGIKRSIELNPLYKNSILIEVEGVGAETLKVLEFAEDYVRKNNISKAEIWLVYDKDSFPPERFNGVMDRIKQLNHQQKGVNYFAGWSNQCIEYWFILHFDYYVSNNDREFYIRYLNRKFQQIGCGNYKKNDPQIYDILKRYGNPELAVRYARKRLRDCSGTPAESAPATTVHNLYIKLSKYFPQRSE